MRRGPTVAKAYNELVGAVDQADSMRAYCTCLTRRFVSGGIVCSLGLDVARVNATIVHRYLFG